MSGPAITALLAALAIAAPLRGDEGESAGGRAAKESPAPPEAAPPGPVPPEDVARKGKAAAKPADADPVWLGLAEGLEALRNEQRPILLRHAADLEDRLADPAMRKVLRGFVLVDVKDADLERPYPAAERPAPAPPPPPAEKPPPAGKDAPAPADPLPPTIGERLGLVKGAPALLVVDFRERVARRHHPPLPSGAAWRRELEAFLRRSEEQAREARKVEKLLERAEYAYKLGETREAILLVLPLDEQRARRALDPVLAERVVGVLARYRKDAQTRISTGEALEAERRYLEAIEVYRKAARGFPFPEVVKVATRKQGEAWRKEQGGF